MKYFGLCWCMILLFGGMVFAGQDHVVSPRIVSLSPAVTEIVFYMGLEDHLVGVTSFCNYPEEAKKKQRVGSVVDVNLEYLIELSPDYVIYVPSLLNQKDQLRLLSAQKVGVEYNTIDSILETIHIIGKILDAEEKAEELASFLQSEIQKIRVQTANLKKPKVLFVISRENSSLRNIYAIGRESYLHEILDAAGAQNIYHDVHMSYPRVSVESMIERNPDVILDFHPGALMGESNNARELINPWLDLPVNASREGRVYMITGDEFVRPGPRLILALKKIVYLIHPELNEENDGQ